MAYCVKCGQLISVRWGQRPICPDCRAAEEAGLDASRPQPEPTVETVISTPTEEADRYLDEQAARFEPPEGRGTTPLDAAMKAKALPGQPTTVRNAVRRSR